MNAKKKHILLVEDEAIIAFNEKADLEDCGYSVTHIQSGEDALKYFDKKNISVDIILMDIDLGDGIDGTETAEKILNYYDIPIVFVSSHTEPEIVEKTEKITSYGYVVKNSGITVLNTSIKMAFKLFNEKIKVQEHQQKLSAAIEELEVSNVELERAYEEMEQSNEELAQSNEQLEASHRMIIDKDDLIIKSEKKFKSYIENAPHGVFVADENGVYLDVNRTASKITGYTRDELIGMNLVELIHEEDRDLAFDHFSSMKNDGVNLSVELRYVTKSGDVRFWHVSANLLPDGTFLGFANDITERKEYEQQLQISDKRYKKAQKLGSVGNWEYDLKTNEFWGSEQAKAIYGFDPEDNRFSTNTVEDCIPDRVKVHQSLIDLIENDTEYNLEFDILRCDNGEKRRIHSIAELERDVNGIPLRVNGVVLDITEFYKNQKILEEREALLKEILENTTNMYYSHTVDHLITYVSPQVKEILGYTPEEAMRKWTDMASDNPINAEGVNKTLTAIETGKKQPPYKLELIRKDGRKIIVEVRECPKVENGKTVAIVGSLNDVTERENVQDQIIQERNRLFTILDAIDDVIYVADPNTYELLFLNRAAKKVLPKAEIGGKCYVSLQGKTEPCDFCTKDIIMDSEFEGSYVWQFYSELVGSWYRCADKIIDWIDGRKVRFEIAVEITETKEAEDKLQKTLNQNQSLFAELQHRVKNSFAMIDSLFSLTRQSIMSPFVNTYFSKFKV